MREVRDAHNYTAWRDALDPHLTRLVQRWPAMRREQVDLGWPELHGT